MMPIADLIKAIENGTADVAVMQLVFQIVQRAGGRVVVDTTEPPTRWKLSVGPNRHDERYRVLLTSSDLPEL